MAVIYPSSRSPTLDLQTFADPPAEYRGVPFWAWNTRLERDQLLRQLAVFKRMGLGGAHFHVRVGLQTPYLGEEFLSLVEACARECQRLGLRAWLYDEDRWPSGAAGGLVTRNRRLRLMHLLFTAEPYGAKDAGTGAEYYGARVGRSGNGELLRRFAIRLERGRLVSARVLREEGETPDVDEALWYAYIESSPPQPWFNNQAYLDTFNPAATAEFLRLTHEKYRTRVGDLFGTTIPAIFTDEPQYNMVTVLPSPESRSDVVLPFTSDFDETYQRQYDESFLDHLPEYVWQCERARTVRYRFFDHVTERFAAGFADVIGDWCEKHGIALTGHMMEEPTLSSQARCVGEAMRSYRSFQLPGIDLLCDQLEITTAKQAQSAARQYGREGVLSELYGVTGWDFDFRGHKLQGDWQAAFGVTTRVHHLAWVTMEGEAKRDYPAAIGYQSPWHELYPVVEDHFARVNTAMTRGTPVCRVGVIHPIESSWMEWGPESQTGGTRAGQDRRFVELAHWLVRGQIDFDFLSECLLASEGSVAGSELFMGGASYEAIIVPNLRTVRRSTLDLLVEFSRTGGTVFVIGEAPSYVDGLADDSVEDILRSIAESVAFEKDAVLACLARFSDVEVRRPDNRSAENLVYQLRHDGECSWLFMCHLEHPANPQDVSVEEYMLSVRGAYRVTLFDTQDGTTAAVDSRVVDAKGEAWTRLRLAIAAHDSVLLQLHPVDGSHANEQDMQTAETGLADGKRERDGDSLQPLTASSAVRLILRCSGRIAFPEPVGYRLSEPNVLLLDRGEWRLDGDRWQKEEEILRLDSEARRRLGWPERGGAMAQPWAEPDETDEERSNPHAVTVRYTVVLKVALTGAMFALERPDSAVVRLDGDELPIVIGGYWVDESIRTIALPALSAGRHVIEVTNTITRRAGLEWSYLLGDFGVRLEGRTPSVTERPERLLWGDTTAQGLPFYAGNITYEVELPVTTAGLLIGVQVADFASPVLELGRPDGAMGTIYMAPYALELQAGLSGTLLLTAYGNRHNAFGPVHCPREKVKWYGPQAWRTTGDEWSDEYCVIPFGVLSAPMGLYQLKGAGRSAGPGR
jgi:hypothetical protein